MSALIDQDMQAKYAAAAARHRRKLYLVPARVCNRRSVNDRLRAACVRAGAFTHRVARFTTRR